MTTDATSSYLEYRAPSGDLWRLEDAAAMMQEFGLERASALPGWHGYMAGQGQPWEILRRYFGLAPTLAPADEAGVWPVERIQKQFGLSFNQVESAMDAAVAHWRQRTLIADIVAVGKSESAEADGSTGAAETLGVSRAFDRINALTPERIDEILESHGFDDVADPIERRIAANRLIEFDDLLVEPGSRFTTTTAIRMELDVAFLNRRLSKLRAEASIDNNSQTKTVRELVKERDAAMTQLGKVMEQLGATQSHRPTAQARVAFQDCVGFLVHAVQDYYADGDRALIDGVYTASEINFLLTPVAERPCQYDPQMVIESFHAQATLWETDFKGHRVNQATSRRLRALYKDAFERMNELAGVSPLSLEGEDERIEGENEIAIIEAVSAQSSVAGMGEGIGSAHAESAVEQHQSVLRDQMQRKGKAPPVCG